MLRAVRERWSPAGREAHRDDVASVRGCLVGLAVAAAFWLIVAIVAVVLLVR